MNDNFRNEFKEFLGATSQTPSADLTQRTRRPVMNDLAPTAFYVFGKLGLIHLFVGAVTLSFCPQFGVSYLFKANLLSFLHKYGETVCNLTCGIFFIGTTAAVALASLTPGQIKVLKNTAWAQYSALALLSTAVLLCLGGEIALTMALVWVAGAVASGVGITKIHPA